MIKNVMLIDDNKIDLFVNQRIIEKYNPGVMIRIFNDAISALCFLKLHDLKEIKTKSGALPDVIFLDVNLPEMDGFKFLEEFKQMNLIIKSKIEVYMLSSSSSLEDINKAKKEELCSGYITKPLTVEKLHLVLNKSNEIKQIEQFMKIV